ncbi:MAG: cytochrome P450 [Podila humilis]|nr:MAG: cytochrome P450 [Podila humilis]
MAALSRLSMVPSFVRTVLSVYLISRSLHTWKRPSTVTRLVIVLSLLDIVRMFIYNKYFHPLIYIPGGSSSFPNFSTAIGTSTGRSHEFIPQAHKKFEKVDRIHEAIELSDQHNLFSSRNKDFHKNHRRLITPAFGLSFLPSLEPLMQDCTRVLISKLDEVLATPDSVPQATVLPKGQVNICSFLNRLSLDIIGETAFGQTFQMVLHNDHPVPKLLAKSLKRSQLQSFNPLLRWLVPYLIDAQVRNLEYPTACINESMRLRIVTATGIPREVPEDTTMAGIFVPAGTIVWASTPSLHLSDEYFPRADQFIPERWIPEESPLPPVQEFTFYPFSAGTRNCVGKTLL